MDKQAGRNAYIYCKLRDKQFALYDGYAKLHGMPMNTLLVLNALYYAAEGLTQTQICQRVMRSKQTVNIITGNLLAKGYATVEEVAQNRRNKLVKLTQEGRAYCGGVVRHITRAEDAAMAMLSPAEQDMLVQLSKKFTQNLIDLVNSQEQ